MKFNTIMEPLVTEHWPQKHKTSQFTHIVRKFNTIICKQKFKLNTETENFTVYSKL